MTLLVFCGANPDHIRYLCVLLLCFEAVSGLKVNLAKSVLVHVGNVDNVVELADIFGCGTSSLPLKYLGMLLGLLTRLSLFGMALWKRWSAGCPVGKGCVCLKAAWSPL
jgi:hypothetical protein